MAAYITVLNYMYSLCVFYYSVLSCVADVADCPLQPLSAIVIKNIIIIIYYVTSIITPASRPAPPSFAETFLASSQNSSILCT